MNYEKKYKEALEKASKLRVQNPFDTVGQMVEHIFPELKESEDERIRKKLIHLVKKSHEQGGYALHKWEADEMLAWLENQKEYESTDFEYVWDRTDCGDLTSALDKYSEEAIINMCHAWYDKGIELERKSWLEKQGDHANFLNKIQIGDKVTRNEFGVLVNLSQLKRAAKTAEKQGEMSKMCPTSVQDEQQPIDKVEPKFKVGDWISGYYTNYKVTAINSEGYAVEDTDGNKINILFENEKFHHLFTITDAKDGDVLVYKDEISLYKHDIKNCTKQETTFGGFVYHCCYDGKRFITDSLYSLTEQDKTDIYPATKSQWDTLFAKMKESGYEWDDEKKELKKIEKKSQRMVSAEAKEALYDKPTDEEMKELLRTEYEKGRADTIAEMYVPTQISPEESLGVSSEKYMDIVDTLTQGGQKPAKWSLEDERVIAIINNALTESNTPPDDYDKVYDWLESLRQKIGG